MTKEELEKEATEYALEWGDKTDGTYACCRDGYLAGAEPREERIAELEKQSKTKKQQLTKAKEIIEKLILQNRKLWVYSDVREEAEQFLKELNK